MTKRISVTVSWREYEAKVIEVDDDFDEDDEEAVLAALGGYGEDQEASVDSAEILPDGPTYTTETVYYSETDVPTTNNSKED